MPEPDLIDLSVQWQSALLDSADTDTIGVSNWWGRAQAALTTAAASATTYAQAVSTACHKLQIDVLAEKSARTIAELEPQIAPRLAEWTELCTRDAIYITAMTRVERTNKRATKPKPEKPTSKTNNEPEPMF